ncbi:hypothetical protein M427DRAFT_35638 [Gonapodya prolifera JEL478]|uniref:MFS general substrate transporter n=1 Tax=Gonapodya prolifera (strain JEL478) TaxID=1344416 RepID=A0A139A4I2_GONPJ|nr:hypothetical protein M427DRAFT_35638 [Gonapodya prolifera JEL478]|eukprot:KXS11498.1 hypothetical protein M427DRAFT_35638 [Gonapodya prolifera JEL478]
MEEMRVPSVRTSTDASVTQGLHAVRYETFSTVATVESHADGEEKVIDAPHHVSESTPLLPRKHTPMRAPLSSSPLAQTLILALTFALGPTFWNALQALGGAGQAERTRASAGLAVLYACFTVSSVVMAKVGSHVARWPRAMLVLGGLGHLQYMLALRQIAQWDAVSIPHGIGTLSHSGHPPPPAASTLAWHLTLLSSAFLGLCKGPLWTTQTHLLMRYSSPGRGAGLAGLYLVVQNVVQLLGAAMPFVVNFGGGTSGGVSEETYTVATLVISLSCITPLLLSPPDSVHSSSTTTTVLSTPPTCIHADPSIKPTPTSSAWRSEIRDTIAAVSSHDILFLIPFFFSLGTPHSLLWNHINLPLFTVRTRALNTALSCLLGILTAPILGRVLDSAGATRWRARAGWGLVTGLVLASWLGMCALASLIGRSGAGDGVEDNKMDFIHPGAAWAVGVYAFSGVFEAAREVLVYHLLTLHPHPPHTSTRISAFRHFLRAVAQSCGFAMSAAGVGVWWQVAWVGAWCVGSMLPVYFVVDKWARRDEKDCEEGVALGVGEMVVVEEC